MESVVVGTWRIGFSHVTNNIRCTFFQGCLHNPFLSLVITLPSFKTLRCACARSTPSVLRGFFDVADRQTALALQLVPSGRGLETSSRKTERKGKWFFADDVNCMRKHEQTSSIRTYVHECQSVTQRQRSALDLSLHSTVWIMSVQGEEIKPVIKSSSVIYYCLRDWNISNDWWMGHKSNEWRKKN